MRYRLVFLNNDGSGSEVAFNVENLFFISLEQIIKGFETAGYKLLRSFSNDPGLWTPRS